MAIVPRVRELTKSHTEEGDVRSMATVPRVREQGVRQGRRKGAPAIGA